MLDSSLSAGAWATLLLAWCAAIISPGPDVFLLMRLAVRERRAAVLAALGIMTGNTIWVVASVLGLTALITSLPELLPILQVAGSLVLIWLGVQSVRAGIRGLRATRTGEMPDDLPRTPYALGFITNIANPKALVFFTALLTQFLPGDLTASDRVLVIALMIGTGLVWFLSVSIACSVPGFRTGFRRFAPWLDIAAGIVFVAVAVLVLGELVVTTSLR